MIAPLRIWLLGFGATLLACLFCILVLDGPVALAIAAIPKPQTLLEFPLNGAAVTLMPLGTVALVAWGLSVMTDKAPPSWLEVLGLAGLAMLWAVAVNDFIFKFAFGRLTVDYRHPGLGDGWALLHGSVQSSFPSGHTVIATAFFSVLWHMRPVGRLFYVTFVALLASDLVFADWHYLSDVIAGLYWGALAGTITVALVRRFQPGCRSV